MKEEYRSKGGSDQITLRLSREEVNRLVNEELQRSALSLGVMVISELLELEVERLCGERRKRSEKRQAYRYGSEGGYVLGAQKVRLMRPRVRTTDGRREVQLEVYRRLQQKDVINEAVMRRLVRGVSCRSYAGVVDTIQASIGISRSSISRAFIEASQERVRQFYARRFDGRRFIAVFIDGVQFKRQRVIVAIGITTDGTKVVLSVRQGATENARVCIDLLEELRDRGVRTDVATLFVLDGSKALHTAVERVWGDCAVVQRCRLHKIRNVRAYVSDDLWGEVLQQMRAAYAETNVIKAR
jgi:putative transposase